MKTIQPGVTGKAPPSSHSKAKPGKKRQPSASIDDLPEGGAPPAFNSTDIPFEHRDFTTRQLEQIFACKKTTVFLDIIPQLEELGGVYREGGRVKANGAAILALRARKLAEARQPAMMPERMSQMVARSIEARQRRKTKNQNEKRGNRNAGAP